MTPPLAANCIRYQALNQFTGLIEETKRDKKAAGLEEDRAEDVRGKRKKISQLFQNHNLSEQQAGKENMKIDLNSSFLAPSLTSFAKSNRTILPLAYSAPRTDDEDKSDPSSQPESDFEKWDKENFKCETIKEQTSHLWREARQAFENGPVHHEEIEIRRYWKLQYPLGGDQHPCVNPKEMQKLFEGYLSEESEEDYALDPLNRRATMSFETFSRVVKDAEAQKQDGAKIREAFIIDWIQLLKSRGIPVDESLASYIRISIRKDLLLTLNYPEYAEKMLAVQGLKDSSERDKMLRCIVRSLHNEASLIIYI